MDNSRLYRVRFRQISCSVKNIKDTGVVRDCIQSDRTSQFALRPGFLNVLPYWNTLFENVEVRFYENIVFFTSSNIIIVIQINGFI